MARRRSILEQRASELASAGNGRGNETDPFAELLQRDPAVLAEELLRARAELAVAKENCQRAAAAAEGAEALLMEMTTGNAALHHLVGIRCTDSGFQTTCRIGSQLTEVSVHPEVDIEDLKQLQPWDYVRVVDQVIVGIWADDEQLYEASFGDVVTFVDYADEERTRALVSRVGQGEEVVRLGMPPSDRELRSGAKLVLMRDDPSWAIACLPSQQSTSRFEVPIDSITTKLNDLACIEPIAEKLILEITKRIVSPEICSAFDLDPLRGMLLSSYRPGMGKTAFMRAFARWLHELGQERGFDVVLYLVKPNELKSMWHGEDARIVREDLFGAIRAKQAEPRTRPLVQLLVLDEVDSLGRRPEGRDVAVSSAGSDALEALLVEMDGMVQQANGDVISRLLVVGMTNRPDRIDDAVKRPGRMGDEVIEIPDLDIEGAEQVCLIYTRSSSIPFLIDGQTRSGLEPAEIAERLIRPALMQVFDAVVLRYSIETQRKIDVTAGQVMASVHFRKAMSLAKNRAAERHLRGVGTPAVGYHDIVEGLLDTALSVAEQMEADPQMLIRHLKIKTPVVRIDVTPRQELEDHRFLTSSH